MSRVVLRRLVAAVVLAVALAACSSTTGGHGRTASRSDVPSSHYDVAVFLCNDASQQPSGGPCSASVQVRTPSVLRASLRRDPAVGELGFVSEREAFAIASRTLPSGELKGLGVGVLPSYFVVVLASGHTEAELQTRYATMPGVGAVADCAPRFSCSVAQLRAVGAVH